MNARVCGRQALLGVGFEQFCDSQEHYKTKRDESVAQIMKQARMGFLFGISEICRDSGLYLKTLPKFCGRSRSFAENGEQFGDFRKSAEIGQQRNR